MKALLIKDFLVVTRQMKLVLLIIPLIAITGGSFMAPVAVIMGAAFTMTAMGFDEQTKWDELAVMMPYTPNALVLSKYLLGYIWMLIAAVLFILAQAVTSVVTKSSISDSLWLVFYSILAGSLFISVSTPVFFRYGTQKGRLIYFCFIAVAVSLGTLLKNSSALELLCSAPLIFIVITLIISIISLSISVRIKKV